MSSAEVSKPDSKLESKQAHHSISQEVDEFSERILQTFEEVNNKSNKYIALMKTYPKIVENYKLYYQNLGNIYTTHLNRVEVEHKNFKQNMNDTFQSQSKARFMKALEYLVKTSKEFEVIKK